MSEYSVWILNTDGSQTLVQDNIDDLPTAVSVATNQGTTCTIQYGNDAQSSLVQTVG
jgi:hypothetical protein